jgi:hypothetical protein
MDTAGSVVIAESTRRLLGGAFEAQGTRAANAERLRRARFRPGHPGDATWSLFGGWVDVGWVDSDASSRASGRFSLAPPSDEPRSTNGCSRVVFELVTLLRFCQWRSLEDVSEPRRSP